MRTLKDVCYREWEGNKNIFFPIYKRIDTSFSAQMFAHEALAIINVLCKENSSSIPTWEKAVKSWLFNDLDIVLRLRYDASIRDNDNCLECLIEHKLIDRIRSAILHDVPSFIVSVCYTILRECRQLVRLNMGAGSKISEVLGTGVNTLSKLRAVECQNKLRETDLTALDNNKFETLKHFILSDLSPKEMDTRSWIQFSTLFKNVTALDIYGNYTDVFLENVPNLLSLRELALKVGAALETKTITVFSRVSMPVLILLYVDGANLIWCDIVRACPRLMKLKFSLCKLTFTNCSHSETLRLKSLIVINLEWCDNMIRGINTGWDDKFEHSSHLQEMADSALSNLGLALYVRFFTQSVVDSTIYELGRWIRNPALLSNCRVRLYYESMCVISLKTSRLDHIRVCLQKYIRHIVINFTVKI